MSELMSEYASEVVPYPDFKKLRITPYVGECCGKSVGAVVGLNVPKTKKERRNE